MHAVSSIVCSCQSTQPPPTEAERVQHLSGLSAWEMSPAPASGHGAPERKKMHARASHLQFSSQAKQQQCTLPIIAHS